MNNDLALKMIGISRKAGKVVFGGNLVVSAVRSPSKPFLVLLASNASDNTRKKIKDSCVFHNVTLIETEYSGEVLAKTIGKMSDVMVIAITDNGLAETIRKNINDPSCAMNEDVAGGAII
jgi:ribosomal protein L7Ae-like RNA K-turn-binding protein